MNGRRVSKACAITCHLRTISCFARTPVFSQTTLGIQQAQALNAQWKELSKEAGVDFDVPQSSPALELSSARNTDSHVVPSETTQRDGLGSWAPLMHEWDDDGRRLRAFLSAQCIFSSPLTRAVQTTLVGLQDHPALRGATRPLTLLRTLREVKNRGSYDSVGRYSEGDIGPHAKTMLRHSLGTDAAEVLSDVTVNSHDAVGEWWLSLVTQETKAQVMDRLDNIMATLR